MFSWRAEMIAARSRAFIAGIGLAHLGRDRDFARQLAEQFRLLGVLPALAVHDVLELGMSGHAVSLEDSSGMGRGGKRGVIGRDPGKIKDLQAFSVCR